MQRIQFTHSYNDLISLENLLEAWREFIKDKRSRKDVQEFGRNLMANLISLHTDLSSGTYRHFNYTAFNISDPKPRQIHKASVRDRVLHHAIYRLLYPFFDRTFTADSFSCRLNKGTHKARDRFRKFANKVSLNHTQTCWVLKCDIRKFFASIDHAVLLEILAKYISDLGILLLLQEIIESFSSTPGVGLPLGNLTSQIFCNIYMNELDQFVKHALHVKYYIRYADDFVLLSKDREVLVEQGLKISIFLHERLKLALHPGKVYIKTYSSGVDFLGWTHFSTHSTLRLTTKKRMFKRIVISPKEETLHSYLGLIKHGNTHKVKEEIINLYASLNVDMEL